MRSLVRASLNARLGANITRTQPGINPAYRIPRGALPTTTFQSRPSSTLDPVSTQEKPRSFPVEGFPTIKADQPAEEEQLFDYGACRYYPVHIGEIFQDRYQVCSKLGWGSCSTTWLARDLKFVETEQFLPVWITDIVLLQRQEICRIEGLHPQLGIPPSAPILRTHCTIFVK
jgi:hypothetical protein